MAKNPSRNRRFIMTKNLIMMLVVLVVGLLAVWSWFTINQKVEANNIRVKAVSSNEVGLAKVVKYVDPDNPSNNREGPDVFVDQLDFTVGDSFKFTKDCTGDGLDLIVPDFKVVKDKDQAYRSGRIVNDKGNWEQALSNLDVQRIKDADPDAEVEASFYELEFYARSKSTSFFIDPHSKLESYTEKRNGSLSNAITDKNDPKKSAYGSFNVDALVGAMRVGLVAQGANSVSQTFDTNGKIKVINGIPQTQATIYGDPEVTMLWVARPDLLLTPSTNTTNFGLSTGLTSGDTFKHQYYKNASDSQTYTPYDEKFTAHDGITNTDLLDSLFIKNNTTYTTANSFQQKNGTGVELVTKEDGQNNVLVSAAGGTDLGKSKVVSNLSYINSLTTSTLRRKAAVANDNDKFYVFKFKLRIWIEGTDSEARRAMDGGQFDLHLEFR